MVALKKLFLCLFFGYSCLVPVQASTVSDDLFPLYRLTRENAQQVWVSGSLTPEQIEERSEENPLSFYTVYIPQCTEHEGQWQVRGERVGHYPPRHPLYDKPLKKFADHRERWGNPKMAGEQVKTRADLAQLHPREFAMVLIPDLKAKKAVKWVPMNALLNEGISFYLKGYYQLKSEAQKKIWKVFFYDNSLSCDRHHQLMADRLGYVVLTKWGKTKYIFTGREQVICLSKDPKQRIYCLEASGEISKRILPWQRLPELLIYDLGVNAKRAKEQPEGKIAIIYWDASNERFDAKLLADWPVLEEAKKEQKEEQQETKEEDDELTEEEQTPQQATNPSTKGGKKRWLVLPSLLGSGGLLAWYKRKKAEAKEKATEKQKVKKKKNINKKGREKGEATVRARSPLT